MRNENVTYYKVDPVLLSPQRQNVPNYVSEYARQKNMKKIFRNKNAPGKLAFFIF